MEPYAPLAKRAADNAEILKQVQCQRTRYFIFASPSDSMVVCPWCDEHETYQRLDADHEAWHYVRLATEMCREEFDIADDGRDAVVWLGDRPETVFEEHLDRHNIYLGRDSDRWQLMYSGSHEAFHRVCSGRKNALHWVDEMFAVLFSLLFLERIGETAHAGRNRIGLIEDAPLISREELLATVRGPLSDGFYGQAYVLGEELRRTVGWKTLKRLAVLRSADGFPDVAGWLVSLAPADRDTVCGVVLGGSEA